MSETLQIAYQWHSSALLADSPSGFHDTPVSSAPPYIVPLKAAVRSLHEGLTTPYPIAIIAPKTVIFIFYYVKFA